MRRFNRLADSLAQQRSLGGAQRTSNQLTKWLQIDADNRASRLSTIRSEG
jgi:hypothetical protein